MNWKKKNNNSFYVVVLLVISVAMYFIGGVFTFEEVTINNFTIFLNEVVQNPLRNWWSDKTLACLGLGLIGWMWFVSDYTYKNRNFHFNKEYGAEDFANISEIAKTLVAKDDTNIRSLSRNIKVSKGKVLSNNNMLIIGSSGSYKTTSMVTPNILQAQSCYVLLDVKGDLLYNYGNYFREQGYTVRSLNLKEPLKSDRYNPFKYIETENDLVKLITNLQKSVKPPDASAGDPFWEDGARMFLQSVFSFEWLRAKDEGRYGKWNNVLELINYEVTQVDKHTTKLQLMMNELAELKGAYYPPVREYRKLKEGAEDTVKSIVITVNAMLSKCETAQIRRIFEDDDINIRELGLGVDNNPNKKVILFLVLPDNDTSYNFLISMFYTQMFDILMRCSDEEIHGPLPIEVEVWMDEFYAGAKPSDPDVLLGVVRSRNISMIPILQSISQIKTLFKNDKWEVIMDNVATVVYLGSGPAALGTHKYISEVLGKTTIDSRNDSMSIGKNGSNSNSYQRMARNLMEPAEVKRMDRKNCIIFLESRPPIFDEKALPFDTKIFKYAQSLPKYIHPVETVYNEKLLEYRTILNPSQVQFLEPEEVGFYKEAQKQDDRIRIFEMDEEEMLYLNWSTPRLSEVEVENLFLQAKGKEIDESLVPIDMLEKENVPKVGTQENGYDLSGSLYECLAKYGSDLTEEQQEEILLSIEVGIGEDIVKSYFHKPAKEMRLLRKAYELTVKV